MDAAVLTCRETTTVLEWVWRCLPFWLPRERISSCRWAICLFRLLMSCRLGWASMVNTQPERTGKHGRLPVAVTRGAPSPAGWCKWALRSQLPCHQTVISSWPLGINSKMHFCINSVTLNLNHNKLWDHKHLTHCEFFQFGKCVTEVSPDFPAKTKKDRALIIKSA